MSFPVGEQFFIDSVRAALKALPAAQQERFAAEVQGFIGQEATHRRIHALFNGHLDARACINDMGAPRAAPRAGHGRRNVRVTWALTAATEHFTAIFADGLRTPGRWTAPSRGCERCGCGTRPRSPSTAAPPSTCTRRSAATTAGASGCSAIVTVVFLWPTWPARP